MLETSHVHCFIKNEITEVAIRIIFYNAYSWVQPRPTESGRGGPGEEYVLLTNTPGDNSSWGKFFSQEMNWPLWFGVAFAEMQA